MKKRDRKIEKFAQIISSANKTDEKIAINTVKRLRKQMGAKKFNEMVDVVLDREHERGTLHFRFVEDYAALLDEMNQDDLIKLLDHVFRYQDVEGKDQKALKKQILLLMNNDVFLERLSWLDEDTMTFLRNTTVTESETSADQAMIFIHLHEADLCYFDDDYIPVLPADLLQIVKLHWNETLEQQRKQRNYLYSLSIYCMTLFGYISDRNLYQQFKKAFPVTRSAFNDLTSALVRRLSYPIRQGNDYTLFENLDEEMKKTIDDVKLIKSRDYPTVEEIREYALYGYPQNNAYRELLSFLTVFEGVYRIAAELIVGRVFVIMSLNETEEQFLDCLEEVIGHEMDDEERATAHDYFANLQNCTRSMIYNGRSPDMLEEEEI